MQSEQALRSRQQWWHFGATALLATGAAALLAIDAATAQVATATPGAAGIATSGPYQAEVRACMEGRTPQDRETCLREARNAQAARERGVLRHPSEDYEANALARCDVFKEDSEGRAACEARVMGYGNVSGSVAGGGVLREVETVVVPPGATEITIQPKTDDPVGLVPARPQQ